MEWRSASTTAARHDDGGALVRQVRLPHEQDHTQPPPWAWTFGWWWAGSAFLRPALERWEFDVRMASSGGGRVEVFLDTTLPRRGRYRQAPQGWHRRHLG